MSSWPRVAFVLVSLTLAYNIVEAAIALWFGAEAESIALFGFGLDSVIETSASALMVWRLRVELGGAEEEQVEHAEQRVRRFIGATFIALAAYVTAQAGLTIWDAAAPAASPVGIGLALVSLAIMPGLAWGKLRAAREIGSRALRAEAKETLACSYLSFTLLIGLGANAVAGWWWADPAAAVLMVPWLAREGLEGLRGEACDDDVPAS